MKWQSSSSGAKARRPLSKCISTGGFERECLFKALAKSEQTFGALPSHARATVKKGSSSSFVSCHGEMFINCEPDLKGGRPSRERSKRSRPPMLISTSVVVGKGLEEERFTSSMPTVDGSFCRGSSSSPIARRDLSLLEQNLICRAHRPPGHLLPVRPLSGFGCFPPPTEKKTPTHL